VAEVVLGRYRETWYRCERPARQLRSAAYVIGIQDMGKSTLLANLAEQFAGAGEGVLVIDTKGELAEDIAARTTHADRLIYVTPGETDYPSGTRYWTLNPLEFDRTRPHLREAAIKNLLALFDRMELADLGRMPQLRQLLYMLSQLAMRLPEPTLGDYLRLLADARLRRRLLADPTLTEAVVAFWTRYDRMTPKQQDEKATTTLPRLNELLAAPVISRVVASPRSTIRLSDWLDAGKLVVINAGKKFDGETRRLLGNFLVAAVVNAGYARPTINAAPGMRTWRVIVDEFHQLAGEQFAEIIEQLRKHQVFPVIAHQNLSQLSDRLTAAATSCALRFFLRVSPDDQPAIRKLFGPTVSDGLAVLPQYHARVQLPNELDVKTLQLPGWWAERNDAQLAAAEAAADDDRFTVREALSPPPSERSDEVSDIPSPLPTTPTPASTPAASERTGPRLLDAFDEIPEVPDADPRPVEPDQPARRPRSPVAAQAHPERDPDPDRDRPVRLLDQFPD
jgi:hypothetical protein